MNNNTIKQDLRNILPQNPKEWMTKCETRALLTLRSMGEGELEDRIREAFQAALAILQNRSSNLLHNEEALQAFKIEVINKTYLEQLPPSEMTQEQGKEIQALFFGTLIWGITMRFPDDASSPYTQEKQQEFQTRLFTHYPNIIIDNSEVDEKKFLFLFEQAVLMLYDVTKKIERKLSLKVGNLLEGSLDTKRYIVGGRSAKDTMRRLELIECLIGKNCPDEASQKRNQHSNLIALHPNVNGYPSQSNQLYNWKAHSEIFPILQPTPDWFSMNMQEICRQCINDPLMLPEHMNKVKECLSAMKNNDIETKNKALIELQKGFISSRHPLQYRMNISEYLNGYKSLNERFSQSLTPISSALKILEDLHQEAIVIEEQAARGEISLSEIKKAEISRIKLNFTNHSTLYNRFIEQHEALLAFTREVESLNH